jgi:hypothetical protein
MTVARCKKPTQTKNQLRSSINYSFRQNFRVPARLAYQWCTSFDSSDLRLMKETGTRKIQQLASNTFILKDASTGEDGRITKTRLVKLYPSRMSWTSTTIAGRRTYSQFFYRITAEGKSSSRLDFTGLQLEPRKLTSREIIEARRKIRLRVSKGWTHLARAMESELRSK